MKYLWLSHLFLFCSLILTTSASDSFGQDKRLSTVPNVELSRYTGKWFEIAKYPNRFQKKCVGNTTATYNLEPNGGLEVVNSCVGRDGRAITARGEAKILDTATNSKLKVRFAPGFLSWLGFVWGDYWVLELGPNYEYSVIGDPSRKYFWILSRKAEMPEATFQGILRRAEAMGFEPGRVERTKQNVETINGAVIERQDVD